MHQEKSVPIQDQLEPCYNYKQLLVLSAFWWYLKQEHPCKALLNKQMETIIMLYSNHVLFNHLPLRKGKWFTRHASLAQKTEQCTHTHRILLWIELSRLHNPSAKNLLEVSSRNNKTIPTRKTQYHETRKLPKKQEKGANLSITILWQIHLQITSGWWTLKE